MRSISKSPKRSPSWRPVTAAIVTALSRLPALALTVALAGCGGGDEPPAAATRSPSPAATVAATPTPSATPERVRRPDIVSWPIPFGAKRRDEMAAYSRRHYGQDTWELRDPHVIVQHITVTETARQAYDIFAADVPDVELRELPGVCAHFVVDTDGTIFQLVPLRIRCRHTVGLNWTAIGIEHVGMSDADLLGNERQLEASLRLTHWLRCTRDIRLSDVIGHNENRESPFHRENVEALKTQTHSDMSPASMRRYRSALGRRTGSACE